MKSTSVAEFVQLPKTKTTWAIHEEIPIQIFSVVLGTFHNRVGTPRVLRVSGEIQGFPYGFIDIVKQVAQRGRLA